MRLYAIFLWKFFTAFHRCRSQAQGRVNFPFTLELFCLFFERFPEKRPTFILQPRRLMLNIRMQMWEQMIPKRGEVNFSARISHDALEFLSSVHDHAFILVPCLYAGLDWQGCANILFTQDEPSDARGNISVFF